MSLAEQWIRLIGKHSRTSGSSRGIHLCILRVCVWWSCCFLHMSFSLGWVSSSLLLVAYPIWVVFTYSVFPPATFTVLSLWFTSISVKMLMTLKEMVCVLLLLWTKADACPQSSSTILKMLQRFLNMSPLIVQGCYHFSEKPYISP